MAITYSIDETKGMMHSEFSGSIDLNDLNAFFEDLRSNKAFQGDCLALHDGRNMENIAVNYRNILAIAACCPWMKGSHRAIVVSSKLMFGMARMYQSILDKRHGTIQIFMNIVDAELWLDSVTCH